MMVTGCGSIAPIRVRTSVDRSDQSQDVGLEVLGEQCDLQRGDAALTGEHTEQLLGRHGRAVSGLMGLDRQLDHPVEDPTAGGAWLGQLVELDGGHRLYGGLLGLREARGRRREREAGLAQQ